MKEGGGGEGKGGMGMKGETSSACDIKRNQSGRERD